MNGKRLKGIYKGCTTPSCTQSYRSLSGPTPVGPSAFAPGVDKPILRVGDYVWSDDPCMRWFIRGIVVWAPDYEASVHHPWFTPSDYVDYVKIALDGPLRRYAMINGGRLRVKRSRLIKADLLERLAAEPTTDGKRRPWPSAKRIKMAIS